MKLNRKGRTQNRYGRNNKNKLINMSKYDKHINYLFLNPVHNTYFKYRINLKPYYNIKCKLTKPNHHKDIIGGLYL